MNYYTSDTHFGHRFVSELRGFDSTDEHDEFLIEQINKTVKKGDTLWVLGDLSMGSVKQETYALSLMKRVPSQLHFIAGNHDSVHPMHKKWWKMIPAFLEVFESVSPYSRMKLAGRELLMNHLPYHGDHQDVDRYDQYRMPDFGVPLLCGHVHSAWQVDGAQFNVGVDMNDFKPVSQEEVIEFYDHVS